MAVLVVCYGHTSILAESDQVQFTENILFGDKEVLEGVALKLKNNYDSRLYWDTTYIIGKEPQVSTDYRFYQGQKYEHYYNFDGDMFFYQDYIRMSYWDGMEGAPQLSQGLDVAMMELYEETGPSERHEKMILLKDYLDYYSFVVDISCPHNSNMNTSAFSLFLMQEELENDIAYGIDHNIAEQEVDKARQNLIWLQTFHNYFRIPVLEKEAMSIAIEKDEDGNVIGWGEVSVTGGSGTGDTEMPQCPDPEKYDCFDFDIKYSMQDGDIYFTFDTRSFAGNIVDTSLIPDGYGIYHFTYDVEKSKIYPELLKNVYVLDPNIQVYDLKRDAKGDHLLLFTIEEELIYMTIIDLDTMQFVDKFPVSTSKYGIDHCKLYEDFMVINGEEIKVFTIDEKGVYQEVFSVSRDQLENLYQNINEWIQIPNEDTVYDWDGQNLVFASNLYSPNGYKNCSFYVGMMNKQGLQYFATYDSSLCTTPSQAIYGNNSNNYRDCHPVSYEPIIIQR